MRNFRYMIEVRDVVNIKKAFLVKAGYDDFSDWNSHGDHVYIGRDMSFYVPGTTKSIWHNPYPVAKNKKPGSGYTLDESLNMYEQHIRSRPDLMAKLIELDNKVLGCWCKPNRCHGDVLARLVKEHCN